MFRIANPESRIPAILQNGTKENLTFQLTLAGVFIAGIFVKDAIETRRDKKKYATETV